MRQSLARYCAPASFGHAPSSVDFITTIAGLNVFGTHRGCALLAIGAGRQQSHQERRCAFLDRHLSLSKRPVLAEHNEADRRRDYQSSSF
jgi:hypothetical protein